MRGSSTLALSAVVLGAPMVARVPFPAGAAARVPSLLAQARDARAYRRVLCVTLALDGKTAAEIASVLGWSPNSVQRVWGRYRAEGEAALLGRPCGGRRHAYPTPAEEAAVLAPYLAEAAAGGVLAAGPIRAAYEARVGKAVPKSTRSRLLARHGRRTVAPRRRHPAQADGVQEEFERSSGGWWSARSPAGRPPAPPPGRPG
jgi:transposase